LRMPRATGTARPRPGRHRGRHKRGPDVPGEVQEGTGGRHPGSREGFPAGLCRGDRR
jgi:hypothetical protein